MATPDNKDLVTAAAFFVSLAPNSDEVNGTRRGHRRVLYLCVIFSLILTACTSRQKNQSSIPIKESNQPPTSMYKDNLHDSSKSLQYLALGDSYTIGEGVTPEERWPVQLVDLLRQHKVDIAPPTIVAATGWTTADLLRAMDQAELKPPYDLVSVLIGVNNQYRGLDVGEYRLQFQTILKRACVLAGNKPERVIVLSIPNWGVTPFARRQVRTPDPSATVGQEIAKFNNVNRAEARLLGVRYVDITTESLKAKDNPELSALDGLHPSGKMYSLWAQKSLAATKAALIPVKK